VTPRSPGASAPVAPASTGVPVSSGPLAIDPAVGRLVWLVDRAGDLGVWTTDLAGGDTRRYLADADPETTTLRDAQLVGDSVVLIREAPSATTAELIAVSPATPPRVLLDAVESFVARGDREVLAVRDERGSRSIWRVPIDGGRPAVIAAVPFPADGAELGPFAFAISPDGRTVAAGWVGGPLEVVGPKPASFHDKGAPLVVADDGHLVAVTGRAGEAFQVDGDRLVELAPPDSDPLGVPGSGFVAWGTVGEDGELQAVEVRDLLAGLHETYAAGGRATNVRQLSRSHVILEATAFDPLTRTVGVVDLGDGRFATFEARAPDVD
jgi:hypothetical protein